MTLDAAGDALSPDDRGLWRLRARLDGIDQALLDTIQDRIRCCLEIGLVKRSNGIPMMQPGRIGLVQERAARYGVTHGVDPAFLCRVYDVVIAETCRLEDLVISSDDRIPAEIPPHISTVDGAADAVPGIPESLATTRPASRRADPSGGATR